MRVTGSRYRLDSVSWARVVTTPVVLCNGTGRPETRVAIERTLDVLAHELGIDSAEIRRRNLIPASDVRYVRGRKRPGPGFEAPWDERCRRRQEGFGTMFGVWLAPPKVE